MTNYNWKGLRLLNRYSTPVLCYKLCRKSNWWINDKSGKKSASFWPVTKSPCTHF